MPSILLWEMQNKSITTRTQEKSFCKSKPGLKMLARDIFSDSSTTETIIVPQLTLADLTISLEEYDKLVFEENLFLVDHDGETIDEVTVAVEDSEGALTVYQYSQDKNRMFRIRSSVVCSLHTQSEVRKIHWIPDRTIMIRITGGETSYSVFALCQEGGDSWRDKMEIDVSETDPVIMEGANIVLLRKIAISQQFGQLKVRVMNHEMELCECLYDIEPPTDRGEVTVRRTVNGPRGAEEMTTVLTSEGHIISHQWSGTEWRLRRPTPKEVELQERRVIQEEQEEEETEEPLKADQNAYFERKEEVLQKLKHYLLEHVDLQDLMADFLKNVLFEEPKDILDFADHFFSEFLGIERLVEDQEQSQSSESSQDSHS